VSAAATAAVTNALRERRVLRRFSTALSGAETPTASVIDAPIAAHRLIGAVPAQDHVVLRAKERAMARGVGFVGLDKALRTQLQTLSRKKHYAVAALEHTHMRTHILMRVHTPMHIYSHTRVRASATPCTAEQNRT
jgi:hypothetical protein